MIMSSVYSVLSYEMYKLLKLILVITFVSLVSGETLINTLSAALSGPLKPLFEKFVPQGFGAVTTLLSAASIPVNSLQWRDSSVVPDNATFDFIIVGAGTAGCILANRLTETGAGVLIIEAGGDPSLVTQNPGLFQFVTNSLDDWNYVAENDENTAEAQIDGVIRIHAGKHLGGSSSSSYTLYNRGKNQTFQNWNLQGWSFDEVLPYYKKLEDVMIPTVTDETGDIHGLNGTTPIISHYGTVFEPYENAIIKSYVELGYNKVLDQNDREEYGAGISYILASKTGLRSSTAINYLQPIQYRPNLSILKNTFCTQILINDDNVAIGVEVETENGETQKYYANKEVILSTGVYRSPQLLMLSGVGPRDQLEQFKIEVKFDSPNVGLNYIDIPASSTYISGLAPILGVAETAVSLLNLGTFPIPAFEVQTTVNGKAGVPNVEYVNLVFGAASAVFYIGCLVDFNYIAEFCNSILLNTLTDDVVNTFILLLDAKSKGNIKLASANPKDAPKIYQGYFRDQEDLDLMTDALIDNLKLVNTTNFINAKSEVLKLDLPPCNSLNYGTYDYWRCYANATTGSLFFATGSCQMDSREDGVLDERFNVRGVDNLRVIDASAIPQSPGALPLGLTMVIAERGADFIKMDNGYI